jgi:hypothetical protein
MKRKLIVLAGIVGVLVGAGFILPALALLRTRGALPGADVGLLLLGLTLTLSGAAVAWAGARTRTAG